MNLYGKLRKYFVSTVQFAQSVQLTRKVHKLCEKGSYHQGIDLALKAYDLACQSLGESNPLVGTISSYLASLHALTGNYSEAELFAQKALHISHETFGQQHPHFARDLNNLADIYRAMGRSIEAELPLKQAIEIMRISRTDRNRFLPKLLNNLAGCYSEMGEYAKAEPLYIEALELKKAILGGQHPDIATSLNNMAGFYEDIIGNHAKAETLLKQALEINRILLGETHPSVAATLNNLAGLYKSTDNYAEAEKLYKQSLTIMQKELGEAHPDLATILQSLASLYFYMGNHEEAEQLLIQSQQIWLVSVGEGHPEFARNLVEQASLYCILGNYSKAVALFQQSIEILQRTLGDSHPSLASALTAFAVVMVATGQASRALDLLQQAATIEDQTIGQIFSISSEAQRIVYLQSVRGTIDIFLSLNLQELAMSRQGIHASLDLVLRRKAIGFEALAVQQDALFSGKYPESQQQLQEWANLRVHIARISLSGPDPNGLQMHQQLLKKLNAQRDELEAKLARQIPEMNLAKKLQNADRYAISKALPYNSALIEFVRFTSYNFKTILSQGESYWGKDIYVAFILLSEKPDDIQIVSLGEAEVIDQMISNFRASITGEAEQRTLEDVLGELIKHAEQSGSSVLHSAILEPLIECGFHRSELLDFRNLKPIPMALIQQINDSIGTKLREKLFDPLLANIINCKRLFLAPDSDLSRLPFEVLPVDKNRRLIEEYHISYLSVGRDLLRFGAATGGQPNAPLVIADPDFDLSSKESSKHPVQLTGLGVSRHSRDLHSSAPCFQRLPGTKIEGQKIAECLGVSPLVEGDALETNLKTSRSPYILHLATHGFFLENQKRTLNIKDLDYLGVMGRLSGHGLENPLLRSGLALAGANTWLKYGSLPPEAEDGILTAEDVSSLDLLNTELVVLSACETGLGEVHTGEGVFGLRRAFALAGAKRLIMSLWSVPDQQTQELMINFYNRMLKGQPCADALRDAQLEMRKKYSNPLYWGAFIFQGDPSRLSFERTGE